MSEFWERYKDPRWQKRRLEIMERDHFECRKCGSANNTLNVHHTHYIKDAMPWEYEDDDLVTFCKDCHDEVEESMKAAKVLLGRGWKNIDRATGFLIANLADAKGGQDADLVPRFNIEVVIGVTLCFGLDLSAINSDYFPAGGWPLKLSDIVKASRAFNASKSAVATTADGWTIRDIPGDI